MARDRRQPHPLLSTELTNVRMPNVIFTIYHSFFSSHFPSLPFLFHPLCSIMPKSLDQDYFSFVCTINHVPPPHHLCNHPVILLCSYFLHTSSFLDFMFSLCSCFYRISSSEVVEEQSGSGAGRFRFSISFMFALGVYRGELGIQNWEIGIRELFGLRLLIINNTSFDERNSPLLFHFFPLHLLLLFCGTHSGFIRTMVALRWPGTNARDLVRIGPLTGSGCIHMIVVQSSEPSSSLYDLQFSVVSVVWAGRMG